MGSNSVECIIYHPSPGESSRSASPGPRLIPTGDYNELVPKEVTPVRISARSPRGFESHRSPRPLQRQAPDHRNHCVIPLSNCYEAAVEQKESIPRRRSRSFERGTSACRRSPSGRGHKVTVLCSEALSEDTTSPWLTTRAVERQNSAQRERSQADRAASQGLVRKAPPRMTTNDLANAAASWVHAWGEVETGIQTKLQQQEDLNAHRAQTAELWKAIERHTPMIRTGPTDQDRPAGEQSEAETTEPLKLPDTMAQEELAEAEANVASRARLLGQLEQMLAERERALAVREELLARSEAQFSDRDPLKLQDEGVSDPDQKFRSRALSGVGTIEPDPEF